MKKEFITQQDAWNTIGAMLDESGFEACLDCRYLKSRHKECSLLERDTGHPTDCFRFEAWAVETNTEVLSSHTEKAP